MAKPSFTHKVDRIKISQSTPRKSQQHVHVLNINPIQTGGGGVAFRTPLRQNRDYSYTERAMTFNFFTFPKIYLGTFWYNCHVNVINHVAMATSF